MMKSAAGREETAVVLTDNRGGLGAVRSLARRGVSVIAVVWSQDDLLLTSSAPRQVLVAQGVTNREKEQSVLDILRGMEDGGAALMTSSDRMVSLMARHREALSRKFRFSLPDTELIEALNDKKRETELMTRLGVPIPKTVRELPADLRDLEELLRFPILFKPASYAVKKLFHSKNAQVRNRVELQRFYESHTEALPVLLAQEVIPGPDGYSWVTSCTFDRAHQMLDCGMKQKIRMYPPHFGGSTFAVSASNDEVYELTRRLGESLRYVGHAGIEFRWDERDRQYKYIECNPRMPENVEFDEACGLRTVWNSYLVAIGEEPESPSRQQRDGVVFIDLRMDLASVAKDGESILSIIGSYLKYLFHKRKGQSFAFDDPRPGLVVFLRMFKRFSNRVLLSFMPRKVSKQL